jgi:hypothetical protein
LFGRLPIEEGLVYHVINRGNNRQAMFGKPADFEAFLNAITSGADVATRGIASAAW